MRTFLICLAVFVLRIDGFSQKVEPDSARHPVYNYFLQGIDDFNQHDLGSFTEQFAEDIHMFTHSGWLRNKQAVRQRFTDIFRQFPDIRMEVDSLNVRQVNANTVIVDFQCRTRPQGKGPAFHTVGSGVYVWREGRWIEVFEHETLIKTEEGMFGK